MRKLESKNERFNSIVSKFKTKKMVTRQSTLCSTRNSLKVGEIMKRVFSPRGNSGSKKKHKRSTSRSPKKGKPKSRVSRQSSMFSDSRESESSIGDLSQVEDNLKDDDFFWKKVFTATDKPNFNKNVTGLLHREAVRNQNSK